MLCIGHRGAMGHEPENTLLSIKKAIALGVDAIEVDVHNVENKLVVIHDRDLSRTTNGMGYLEHNSFAYVRSLDAGKGEQVPTLEEVLKTVDRQVIINIELKGNNTAKLVIDLIKDYLKAGWSYTDFVVSSFDHDQLHQVKAICPEIVTGMLIYGLPWQYLASAHKLQATLIIPSLDYVTSKMIESAHQQGFKVWVYTVNQPDDLKLMRALGVDGIFTNYPERVFSHGTD
jgi:glycerophosphoryl diester phosphodiesterase